PLGFIEVRFASVPLALPTRDNSERCRNLTAIRQQPLRLFKITHRSVIILEAGIVIVSLRVQCLTEIGLKNEGGFCRPPCLIAERSCWFKNLGEETARIHVRK